MTAVDTTDVWGERIRRAQAAYPQTTADLTKLDTGQIVKGEEFLVRVLRDLLAIDNVEVRRGQRPEPDVDEGRQLLAELRGQDFTVQPFHQALRILAGTRSLANLERRTGLSRSNLARLLRGEKAPKGTDMEAVAVAFAKRPMYFAEYRTAAFVALVYEQLAADPDRSAVLAHRLGLR